LKSLRPWDPQTDLFQYESNFKIMTKSKHNLKLSNHCIASPRSSLLTLHHRQTPRLIQHRHHPIVSNVVESNECIGMNTQSNEYTFTRIKYLISFFKIKLKPLMNHMIFLYSITILSSG